jgi:hypothetical protein
MIILTSITDKVQVSLNEAKAANDMQCLCTWRDRTVVVSNPGRTIAMTDGTNDVDIVPAPGSETQRVIDSISIYNNDTANKILTIKFNANGTIVILWKGTLGTGEKLEYNDKSGFFAYTANGSIKQSQSINSDNPTSNMMNGVVLAADVINNNAVANTLQNVTGLSFNVVAGKTYWFDVLIPYTAAAATTGSRWTINGPAFSMLNYSSEYSLTATTQTINYASAYQQPAAANASSLTVGNTAWIGGIIKATANGVVQIQFASEIASSAITAKAGAILRWQEIL